MTAPLPPVENPRCPACNEEMSVNWRNGKLYDYCPNHGEPATGIEAEVCQDIERRQQIGIKKYGVTVAENPLQLRDWLQHAYEETLDQAVYLKRAITEIDSANAESSDGGQKPLTGK